MYKPEQCSDYRNEELASWTCRLEQGKDPKSSRLDCSWWRYNKNPHRTAVRDMTPMLSASAKVTNRTCTPDLRRDLVLNKLNFLYKMNCMVEGVHHTAGKTTLARGLG